MDVLYTAEALSTGDGRNGHGSTASGRIDVDLTAPEEMGGSGTGTNPEELFAVGYAACFHSALRMLGKQAGADMSDSSVGSRVLLGKTDSGGFGLAVELEVILPNVDGPQARKLADDAHQVCPYSNATRGNIDVTVTVADD